MALHPILQGLVVGLARTGVKAGVAALESVLADVDDGVEHVRGKVASAEKTIAKAKKIRKAPARRIKVTARTIKSDEQKEQEEQEEQEE